ncbi:hypothetical protein TcCL_ESM09898 [Trypanosoma cruzi]|nr:hypothetical protein TcCL_ESM09898 [Trypanosoma cruzi]
MHPPLRCSTLHLWRAPSAQIFAERTSQTRLSSPHFSRVVPLKTRDAPTTIPQQEKPSLLLLSDVSPSVTYFPCQQWQPGKQRWDAVARGQHHHNVRKDISNKMLCPLLSQKVRCLMHAH